MEVLYPRCAGLDVHKATVVAAVRLVAGGKVAREVRTFATTTAGLLALAAWLGENGCTHVAMEATGVYWKPVWHVLAEGGFDLVLANAAQVKNVPGRKTDVNDATWLAELLAHGLVRASFVPDAPTQELRSLLRTRKQLVRERASHVLRLQKTLEDANVKLDAVLTDLLGRSGRAMLEALVAGETDPDQFYTITLTVKDAGGLTSSTFVNIKPRTSTRLKSVEPRSRPLRRLHSEGNNRLPQPNEVSRLTSWIGRPA